MEIKIGKVDPVLIGRILGGLIILIALASSIYRGTQSGGFWTFLSFIVTPMGIGFLIIMVTEVLNVLQRKDSA